MKPIIVSFLMFTVLAQAQPQEKVPTLPASSAHEFKGTVDKEEIRSAIRSNMKYFKKCYDAYLKRDKTAHGRVDIEFDFEGPGKVIAAKIVKSGMDEKMNDCMIATVKAVKFPDAPENQVVRTIYPFVFSAE